MLKPASCYKTRLGRRTAIICYVPVIPVLAIGYLIWTVIKETPSICRDIASVWNQ